jgi:hypothetical protein
VSGDSDIRRLLAAFRHEPVDRVPNFEYLICKRNVSAILGKPAGSSWQLPASDYLELVRRIGMDAVGGKLFLRAGQILSRVPARTLGDRSALGAMQRDGTIRPAELDRRRLDEYFAAVEGTRIGVWVHLSAGLTMVYEAMGIEQFCLTLQDDPSFVEELLELVAEDNIRSIGELLDYPFSFFHLGDDLGHKAGLLVSPDYLRRVWAPRIARTLEPLHRRGMPVTFHCDGNIQEAIPLILELGFCSLNPIEPYGMDIRDIKRRFGKSLCLVGNVDVAGKLAFGSPEEVRAEVNAKLGELAPGGGYVCATSHSVIDGIPPENFRAMIDAVHAFRLTSSTPPSR